MWTPRQRKLTKTVSRQKVYNDGNGPEANNGETLSRHKNRWKNVSQQSPTMLETHGSKTAVRRCHDRGTAQNRASAELAVEKLSETVENALTRQRLDAGKVLELIFVLVL
jgi:hypothetical protein